MSLPALNACLNFTSAVLLATGYVLIRQGKIAAHRACMGAALTASTLFLVSYVAYHWHAGHVHYAGLGWKHSVYLAILISHTLLAMVIVPLVLRTLYLAWQNRFETHRKWARWTLPLWFYVNVTGVVIYEMLY